MQRIVLGLTATLFVSPAPDLRADERPSSGAPYCETGSVPGARPIDIVRIQPAYPRAAFAAGLEGTVTLVFTITERGEVEDAYVLRSEPPGVFDLAARAALQRWKFLPLCIGGRWEPYREATYTMSFLLKEAYLED